MDYFLLRQDDRYKKTPTIIDLHKKLDKRKINIKSAHELEDTIVFYIKPDKDNCFLDVLDSQLYLVSDRLKKLIAKYQPDIEFKTIALIDIENKKQKNYYLPIFEEIEALSEKSEYNIDKSVIKKLVLDSNRVKTKRIFKIKEGQKTLIVARLDFAESILRRDFDGIYLKKIQTE